MEYKIEKIYPNKVFSLRRKITPIFKRVDN